MPGRSLTGRTVWLPSSILGVFMLVTAPANFFLPVFFAGTLHFSEVQIGLLFALQAGTGVLAALPTGVGNDRISSRSLIALALAGIALGYYLMGTVTAFLPFALVYVFGNLCTNVLRLSLDVQVLKLDDGTQTGRHMGIYHGLRFAGLVVGTVAAGYALERYSFVGTLAGVAVLCLALVLATRALPPTPLARASLGQYGAELRSPRVLLFATWTFLFALHWGAEYTVYGLFLHDDLGLSLPQMGWYMGAEFGVMTVVVLVAGRFAQRPAVLTAFMAIGLTASGLGQIGMVIDDALISVLFRCLHGVGDALFFLVLYVGIVRLFAAEHIGGTTGVLTFVQMAATIIGALIASAVGARFGHAVPLWASGILNLMLVIPVLAARGFWRVPRPVPAATTPAFAER